MQERLLKENEGPCLTDALKMHYIKQQVKKGTPCRFMYKGRNLNISTGLLAKNGINVMYQLVYWHFTKATARDIAKHLKCKVIFSE